MFILGKGCLATLHGRSKEQAMDESTRSGVVEPGLESPLDSAMSQIDASAVETVARAVDHGAVLLAYQPIVRGEDPQRIAFWEGLVRVLDDRGRVVPARDFIAAVETTELGRILDCRALELGLQTLAEQPELRLAINMSARSIGYPVWVETLRRGIRRGPTVAERLILEITEASAMVIPDLVASFMRDMRRRGISFALDDFGAGYTSFRYLRQFYFDAIKIDAQFIRRVNCDADNQCLTRALLAIAEHFDMFTVAEGVEHPEEAETLRALGVDCMQGYLFGMPTTLPPWAKAQDRRRTA
jgi:EAL domain-containing protein (putative c-di-GMP-specific phosphodiesterase class I)